VIDSLLLSLMEWSYL